MHDFSSDANDWRMDGLEADTQLILSLSEWTGKKPSRIAADLGMAATTLARPASGKATTRLGRTTLAALEEAFPDFPGWGISKAPGRASTARISSDDDIVEIAELDLSLSMGPGTLIEEFVESEPVKIGLRFVQDITRTPSDRLRFVTGIGDSMEPTLRHGDRVLVDINERQLSRMNGIYWIDHFGAHGIKRLRAAGPGRVMVMSDNPHVPDFEVGADELRIEGRIVWFARGL